MVPCSPLLAVLSAFLFLWTNGASASVGDYIASAIGISTSLLHTASSSLSLHANASRQYGNSTSLSVSAEIARTSDANPESFDLGESSDVATIASTSQSDSLPLTPSHPFAYGTATTVGTSTPIIAGATSEKTIQASSQSAINGNTSEAGSVFLSSAVHQFVPNGTSHMASSATPAATGTYGSSGKASVLGNRTIANFTWTGDCWQQWSQYWSAKTSQEVSWTSTINTISTATDTRTELLQSSYWSTTTRTTEHTVTVTDFNGEFAQGTSTWKTTDTDIYTGWYFKGKHPRAHVTGTGKTYTDHFPVYIRTEITGHYTATGLHEPSCALPSYVPDCQSEWKTYIETDSIAPRNTVPLPQCTQASITGSLCDSLIAAYYKQYTYLGGMIGNPGYQTTNGTSTYWPSTTQFAPGCTLGCQTCAITGETVQLFYWPPTTANLVADGSGTAKVMTAQTNATMVTTVNGTVLTSPTIYISYDKLYASDSCSGIGSTHYNTIIALTNTADLKSLSWDGLEYVGAMYKTVSFTLDDLVKPIPDSVYNKMVRCQASAYAWKDGADHAGVHFGTDFTCDRTGPYAPIIAVPPQVTALDPNWAACTAWYGGLYDPPKALQGAPAIATPTLPNAPITTPAAPASKASETQAAETRVSEAQAPRSSDAVSSREASKTAGNGDIADPKTGGSTSADTRSIGNQADPTPAGGATAADTHSNGDPADPVLSGVDSSIDTNDRGGQTASQFPGGDTSSDTNDSGNQANPASLGDSIFSVTNDRGSQTDSASPGGNNPKDTRGGGSQADFTSPGQGVSGDTNSNDDQADPTLSYEDEPSDNSNNGDRESQVSTSDAAERTSRNGNQVAAPRTTQGVAGAVLSSIGGTATGFNTIDPQGTSSGGSSAHAIATDTNQQGVTATSAKDGPGSEAVATAAVDSGDRTSGSIKNDDEDDSVHSPSVTVHTVNAADGTTVEGIAISAAATGSGQGDAAVIGGHALGAGQAFSTNKVQVSVDSHGSVVLQQPASRTTANLDGEAPPSFNRQGVVITGSGHAVTASQIAIDTYAFGSMTLRAGEQTTLDNGRLVSVGTAGLKVEGIAVTASAISTPTSADFNAAGPSTAEFMVGGKHYTAVKVGSGLYAVGSTTFSTGQSATLDDGAIIGAGTGGLVVDGTTVPTSEFTSLASPASKQVGAVVTAGGKRLTAYADQSHPGIAIVNSQTLSLGGLVVTLDDGEIVTLASKGLVGGTQTAAFSTITKAFGKGVKAGHVVFTDRGHTYTAEENGDERDIAVVDGTTLSLGGSAITLDSGAVVSLGSSGVVADGRTWTFSSMSSVATSDLGRGELDEAVFKASGATYTAVESQGNTRTAVVEGKTLSIDGPRATLDTGALISLGSGGLAVDGSKTMAFSSASGPQMTGSPRADSSPMASSEQTAGYGLTSTSIAASSIPTSENGCRSAARNLFSPCVAVLLTVLTLVCT